MITFGFEKLIAVIIMMLSTGHAFADQIPLVDARQLQIPATGVDFNNLIGAANAAIGSSLAEARLSPSSSGNDTAVIQAACSAGKVIYLAPGTYNISKQISCTGPIIVGQTGDCYYWYEGYPCKTVLQQIAGTWAANDAIIKAVAGQPAVFHGIQAKCALNNGVNGFEIGGVHGVTLDQTRATGCSIGYSILNGLTQNVSCLGCMADQNQLWGLAVQTTGSSPSLADSQFIGFNFNNNGISTTNADGVVGSVYCFYCSTVGFIGGHIENNYGAASNGFQCAGILFAQGTHIIRMVGNKFDNNCQDIRFVATGNDGTPGFMTFTGNASTTIQSNAVWLTGSYATTSLYFVGNIWYGGFKADNLGGAYAQCVNCSINDLVAGGYADAYTNALLNPLTISPVVNARVLNKPTDPVSTTSATGAMMGLAQAVTPAGRGRLMAIFYGDANSLTAGTNATVQIRYGTGTAPTNGNTTHPGTSCGSAPLIGNDTQRFPVTLVCTLDGLVKGTAYWFDLEMISIGGAGVQIKELTFTAQEN